MNQISYNSAWGQMTEEKRVAHLQIYQIKYKMLFFLLIAGSNPFISFLRAKNAASGG